MGRQVAIQSPGTLCPHRQIGREPIRDDQNASHGSADLGGEKIIKQLGCAALKKMGHALDAGQRNQDQSLGTETPISCYTRVQ